MLGFAQKAGKLVYGADAIERSVHRRKLFLLIVAKDSSAGTKQRYQKLAATAKIPIFQFFTKDQLGHMIGKSQRSAVGLLDRAFATPLERDLRNESGQQNRSDADEQDSNL